MEVNSTHCPCCNKKLDVKNEPVVLVEGWHQNGLRVWLCNTCGTAFGRGYEAALGRGT